MSWRAPLEAKLRQYRYKVTVERLATSGDYYQKVYKHRTKEQAATLTKQWLSCTAVTRVLVESLVVEGGRLERKQKEFVQDPVVAQKWLALITTRYSSVQGTDEDNLTDWRMTKRRYTPAFVSARAADWNHLINQMTHAYVKQDYDRLRECVDRGWKMAQNRIQNVPLKYRGWFDEDHGILRWCR